KDLAAAQAELSRLVKELPTTEMMLTIPVLFRGRGYYESLELQQNTLELLGLVKALQSIALDAVCEIGTLRGGTLFVWCQLAAPSAHVISIDLPGGGFGGGYHECSLPFFEAFRKPGQRLQCLRGSSHDERIRDDFRRALGDRQLDFLFIDGDHSYEGVKSDFAYYSRFVRPGGFGALHE